MQWLIDLIIESIGVPPVFIDRGDPANDDFLVGSLVRDGAWHDLDLSSIVPSNASCVALAAYISGTTVLKWCEFRKKGNVNVYNESYFVTQVANVSITGDFNIPIGSDGLLQYRFQDSTINNGAITVKGWWL